MQTRRIHRLLGIVLLLPFFGWALTGIVFFVKPGYADAYAILQPKTYPLASPVAVTPADDWLEFRYLKTVLGEHLLVRTDDGWQQLQPGTNRIREVPGHDQLQRLLTDALQINADRYGNIVAMNGNQAVTDTDVEISIDWNRLTFQQQGADTRRIDMLYRIHYLQWTGISTIDKALGFAGLLLLITMTLLGARLAFAKSKPRHSGTSRRSPA